MWNFKIFCLLLLAICNVVFVCSEPVGSEDKNIESDAGVTLSTELLPPPLPAGGEHRGIVYLINLFAVKNKSADVSADGKKENELVDDSPEVIGPLATVLLVVDDDDDIDDYDVNDSTISNLDDSVKEFIEDDYTLEEINPKEKSKEDKTDLAILEEPKVPEDKMKKLNKNRRKRTLSGGCKQCNSGYGNSGGHYPSGGNREVVGVIPILVIPVNTGGGGGGGRGQRGHRRGNRGGHGGNSNNHNQGNGYGHQPVSGGYPNQGGNHYPGGSGGGYGGSGSYSQASAQAQSQSSSYGG